MWCLVYIIHYVMIGDRELTEEKDIMGQIISAEGDTTKIPVFLDQRNWKRFLPSDKFSVPDTPQGKKISV